MQSFPSDQRVDCFDAYNANIHINNITMLTPPSWSHLFGAKDRILINVELTNTGTIPFVSTRAFGSVFMSFNWVDSNGRALFEGIRSALPAPLLPAQSVSVDVVTEIPSLPGLSLRLSPVQEGCAWFYSVNPKVGAEIVLKTGK